VNTTVKTMMKVTKTMIKVTISRKTGQVGENGLGRARQSLVGSGPVGLGQVGENSS
jgi:hypothetical protein